MNSGHKNTRSGAATLERAGTGAETEQATTTKMDFNTPAGRRQIGRLSEILPCGKANAVTGQELVTLLQLADLRELTKLVERERRDGFPVCAATGNDKGYYLASDADELDGYIKSLGRRIHNISRTMTHLEDALDRMTGQGRMEGF